MDAIVQCPTCGKFVNPDGRAFYTREPEGERDVVACCDETCADNLITRAMAEFLIDRAGPGGSVTEADLLTSGFTCAEINRHIIPARSLARTRMSRAA